VRNAQLSNYNFILVVGEKEQQNGTVNVRTRDNKVHGEVSITEMIRRFGILARDRVNLAEDFFGTLAQADTAAAAAPKQADGPAKENISEKYC